MPEIDNDPRLDPNNPNSFVSRYGDIQFEINKRKTKWALESISFFDFDDLRSLIENHLFVKWHLYDPNKGPLSHWVSRVCTNFAINMNKMLYSNFKKVCLSCSCAEGEHCRIYGTQDPNKCPLLAKWEQNKKSQHDIKLPLSLEYHAVEAAQIQYSSNNQVDVIRSAQNLHKIMTKILKGPELKLYKLLYIKNKDEQEIAKIMNPKCNSKEKYFKTGYRWIHMLKKRIIEKVKKVVYSDDFDIVK